MRSKPNKDGIILPKSWCRECNNQATTEYYRADPEYARWRQTQQMLRLKRTVLSFYGSGKCACVTCGEERIECLSIDHVNGNGRQHRIKIGLKAGGNFYLWLRKQGYPEGYQTMCMNCQFVKKARETDYRAGRDSIQYKGHVSHSAGVHLKCIRCGHEWNARSSNTNPKTCPSCSNPWDKPSVRFKKQEPVVCLG